MVVYLWKYLWKKTQASLKYVKIALCAIVVYLLILTVFARVFQTNKNNIYAKTAPVKKTDEIRAFITDKKMNSTKEGRFVVSIYKGVTCSLIGEACYADLDKVNPSNTSTFIASVLAYPFLNPPASGVGATIQTLAQAGFIPKSYAAEGVGFASIRPLMGVWKAMRDVAYLVLVLVIVTIGFMIMLRTKINPQTIVNVENSLPKIVMALIYITFSFAIAGFLIDLMYVSIVLIIAILGPEQTTRTPQQWMGILLQAHPGNIIDILVNFNAGTVFWTLPSALLGILGNGISVLLRIIISGFSMFFIVPFIDKVFDFIGKLDINVGINLGGVVNLSGLILALLSNVKTLLVYALAIALGALIVPVLIGVIIFLTVLMLFFRIFFTLFSSYIKLLVLVIISPLYLLMEAIPGQSTFSSWIKNLLGLLVPFPVIIGTFLIGSIIMSTSSKGTLWTPPFLYGLNAQYLSAIIGMWVLFMIPDFIGIAQKAINPKPVPIDAGIGSFFGGAKTGIETGLGEASKYALLSDRIPALGKVFKILGMGKPKDH